MSEKEFEKIKSIKPLYKVRVKYGESVGHIREIKGEHIDIQFEGPIPEPLHYSEVELMTSGSEK